MSTRPKLTQTKKAPRYNVKGFNTEVYLRPVGTFMSSHVERLPKVTEYYPHILICLIIIYMYILLVLLSLNTGHMLQRSGWPRGHYSHRLWLCSCRRIRALQGVLQPLLFMPICLLYEKAVWRHHTSASEMCWLPFLRKSRFHANTLQWMWLLFFFK